MHRVSPSCRQIEALDKKKPIPTTQRNTRFLGFFLRNTFSKQAQCFLKFLQFEPETFLKSFL